MSDYLVASVEKVIDTGTYCSQLLTANIPSADVSKRLGHSRPSTTMNIYAHVIDTNEDKIIEAINHIFNKKAK